MRWSRARPYAEGITQAVMAGWSPAQF